MNLRVRAGGSDTPPTQLALKIALYKLSPGYHGDNNR